MSIDEQLRRALHHQADRVEPGDGSWLRIQRRFDGVRRRRQRIIVSTSLGAVAAAMLLVVATLGTLDDGGSRLVETGPAGPSPTTSPPPTALAPPAERLSEDEAHGYTGIWPFATQAELLAWLESGNLRHEDPVEAVLAFAVEYLGMVDPVVGQPSGPGPDGTLEVTVQPRGEGGQLLAAGAMETIVHLDPEGPPWIVLFTRSSNIRVDGGTHRDVTGSPIPISGRATAYEGTVDVEVREAGMGPGEALGRGIVTAGALGTLGPFAAEIAFEPPTTEGFGALVLSTQSAVDGATLEATVVALNFGNASSRPGTINRGRTEVTAFFLRGEELVPVTRTVPATAGVLGAALDQLLVGPTEAERAGGLGSMFLPEARGKLRGVAIDGDGRAVVDLPPGIYGPGVGTSTASSLLLDQLNATVFQFPTVSSVEYRLDGSCEAFFMALERRCQVLEHPSS